MLWPRQRENYPVDKYAILLYVIGGSRSIKTSGHLRATREMVLEDEWFEVDASKFQVGFPF